VSSGKDAVRDLRYGRRGGRWANEQSGKVGEVLDSLHRERMAAIRYDLAHPDEAEDPRKRKWPVESIEIWRDIAANHPEHPSYDEAREIVALVDRGDV
jgi:hypothetical protein